MQTVSSIQDEPRGNDGAGGGNPSISDEPGPAGNDTGVTPSPVAEPQAPAPEPEALSGPAVRLFDPAAARNACDADADDPFGLDDERSRLLRAMATDAAGGCRGLAVPQAPQVKALRALVTTTPHLADAVSVVADSAEAALRQGVGFACPPLLVAGPPGVGKTRLIRRMLEVLELPLVFLDGSALDDTASIAGHSRSWRASRPGAVATEMIRGKVANMALVLDEIDKVAAGRQYGPTVWDVLHGLLEPETARRWQDTCLEVPIDASHLVVMATANAVCDVPAPLVDRFLVVPVENPDGSDLATLIQAVSADVAAGFDIADAPLATGVLPLLAGLPPRRLRTILRLAWARALAVGRDRPGEGDIRHAVRLAGGGRTPIGFATDRRALLAVTRSQP